MSSKLSENLTSKSESWQLFEDKMLKKGCFFNSVEVENAAAMNGSV